MSGRKDQLRAIHSMTVNERERALGRLQGEAYLSAQGVSQQARRLRENCQCGPEFMADGRTFAYLFRDVVRAANAAQQLLSDDHLLELQKSLTRVDAACPDGIGTRDALEHFDDYIFGVGCQQQKKPGEYAQIYERGSGSIQVRVGSLMLDVELAEQAALHLASVLLVGQDYLGLLPTGNY